MTMSVDKGSSLDLRRLECLCVFCEKFAKQKNLTRKLLHPLVVGEKIENFIPENRSTAGFEHHNGSFLRNFRPKKIECVGQQALGTVEHSEVIKWAATTHVGLRNL